MSSFRDCFDQLLQTGQLALLLILIVCTQIGCSTHEEGARSQPPSTSHDVWQSNANKIQELLRCELENKEPTLGHLSDYELQISSYGMEAIPHVVPWMTSEDPSKRYVAARILERVSIVQFGWKLGADDSEWRHQDWREFWKKHGDYSPDLDAKDARVAQTLWEGFIEAERKSTKRTEN